MRQLPFWRVCRVLANRPRIRMLRLLSRRPGLRVADVARAMTLSRPAASQYLRALEACGFLIARRIRRSVVYALDASNADSATRTLTKSLLLRLRDKSSIESVFKLATTFANPGRIDVFRNLTAGPKSLAELASSTAFPQRTLWRHLQKLQNRGFVRQRANLRTYEAIKPADEFARALAQAVST